YAAADIAVSRAGMGVLTELSYLGKPAILIPMPDSHQEDNAEIFKEKQAAIVLNQKELTAEKLVENIKKLLNNRKLQNKLSSNIKTVIKKGANDRIVEIINNIIKKK
ncbi:undecaprenyldiphospho-muramoylpentapeptide beta-N-acetylglucosaminyltransferase, partial [Patescibacteria group bacterium]|nr:undecaprenyldiphospho-muramoylpentapeptide beta-N-acetylglucosaminyltransferase [Patescibacteria group bacterium]